MTRSAMILTLTGSKYDYTYHSLKNDVIGWINEQGDADWHICDRWMRSRQINLSIMTIAFKDEETYTLFRLEFDERYIGKY